MHSSAVHGLPRVLKRPFRTTVQALGSYLRHMDSLPDMSLGRLEKNFEDWDSSSTLSQASFDSQLNGFRLTCAIPID